MNVWELQWSDEDLATLRRKWAEGASAREISEALKSTRSRSAVLGKIHRLGLSRAGGSSAPSVKRAQETMKARREETRRLRAEEDRRNKEDRQVAKARAREAAQILPLPNAIICNPVGIVDLEAHHCRFILGGGDDGLALYCGSNALPGGSWCTGHHRIVFRPAQQPERKRSAA